MASILITTPITNLSVFQTDSFGRIGIPEDASGPVTIHLEQSIGMLTWVGTNPGTYIPSEARRFFRLRATMAK